MTQHEFDNGVYWTDICNNIDILWRKGRTCTTQSIMKLWSKHNLFHSMGFHVYSHIYYWATLAVGHVVS